MGVHFAKLLVLTPKIERWHRHLHEPIEERSNPWETLDVVAVVKVLAVVAVVAVVARVTVTTKYINK